MVEPCISPNKNCLLWKITRLSQPDKQSPSPSCSCFLPMKPTFLPNDISGTPSVRPDPSPSILERYKWCGQKTETKKNKTKKNRELIKKGRQNKNANVPVTRAQQTRQPSEQELRKLWEKKKIKRNYETRQISNGIKKRTRT